MRSIPTTQKCDLYTVLLRGFWSWSVCKTRIAISLFIVLIYSFSFGQNGVSITSTANNPTQQNPVPLTFKFDQPVNGFEEDDIVRNGGNLSNFYIETPKYAHLTGPSTTIDQFSIGLGDVLFGGYEAKLNKIPIAIDVNSKGEVFVLTFGNGIRKFNSNGQEDLNFAINGSRFDSPLDLAINSKDEIYVADNSKRQILVFSEDGTFLPSRTLGSGHSGGNRTEFYGPMGLEFDSVDNLYIADYYNGTDPAVTEKSRVKIYYSNGDFYEFFGRSSSNKFNSPYRLFIDENFKLIVADLGTANGRVQLFDVQTPKAPVYLPEGNVINNLVDSPGSITVDNYGFIYIADFGPNVNITSILNLEGASIDKIANTFIEVSAGIAREDYKIKVFDYNLNYRTSIIKEIDLPVDLALLNCGSLLVNNATLSGNLPFNFKFDLEFYNHLPDTFTADLTIDEECEAAVVTIPPGVGQNKDCQPVPTTSSKFEMLWDETAPILKGCPEEAIIEVESGFTIPNYFEIYDFKAEDNCEGNIQFRQTPPATTVITEDTTVNIVAIDEAGNESQACTFLLKIKETPEAGKPEFTFCTPPNTFSAAANQCGMIVNYQIPTAKDNSGSIEPELVEGRRSGDFFPVGTTVVKYRATGASGAFVECSFKITVTDDEDPVFANCPEIITAAFEITEGFEVGDYSQNFVATDNCSENITYSQNPAPGTIISTGGDHPVVLTATDADRNSATCEFIIQLTEMDTLSLNCNREIRVPANDQCEFILPDLSEEFTYFPEAAEINQSIASGEHLTEDTEVIITATYGGKTETCTIQVKLVDHMWPELTCPTIQNVTVGSGEGFALPNYVDEIEATDNCRIVNIVQDPLPGTVVTEDTTVKITAEDTFGNFRDCFIYVYLQEEPEGLFINCPAHQSEDLEGKCVFSLPDYRDRGTTSEGAVVTQSPAPGTMISEETTITLTATLDGETKECTFQVELTNTSQLAIACPQDVNLYADNNGDYILEDYTGEATVTEACSNTTIIQDPPPGQVVTGDTPVTLTVIDEDGNENDCSFTVKLAGAQNPGVASCKPAFVYLDALGNGVLNPEKIFDGDPNDASIAKLEVDRVNFDCEDLRAPVQVNLSVTFVDGSTSTCTALVTVKDDVAPVATCVETFTLNLNQFGTGRITPEILNRGSTDNCNFIMSLSKETFGVNDVGTQEVTLTVTDEAGNVDKCTTQVIVVAYDEESPGLTCAENIEVKLDENGTYRLQLNYSGDDANEDYELSQEYFTCDDLGTQTVTVTYWGEHTGTCEIEVTVVDENPPIISCISELEVRLNAAGNATISSEDFDPEYSDNCSVAQTSISKTNFTTADIGANDIILTVTDASGNISTCTTTVNVIPFEGEEPEPVSCVDILVLQIGEDGTAKLNPRDLFSGGTGSIQFSVSKDTFSCYEIGEHSIFFEYTSPTTSGSCDIRIIVEDPSGNCGDLVDPTVNDYIILYPNPGDGNIRLQPSPGLEIHYLEVFDMRGRFLIEKSYENPSFFDARLDLSEYQSGVYTLFIKTNKKDFVKRAIIHN